MNHCVFIKSQWRLSWFFNFARNITSWACLLKSGLKFIVHWKAQILILFKSSLKVFADKGLSCITEKRYVPSANNLGFETKFSDQSFIYILKNSGTRIEPWGTPASTSTYVGCWIFRTTLCFLFFRKFAKIFSKLPTTRFCFNL